MSKKKYQDKPIYWGYYGNLRGEWMKEHEKELFQALEEAGELDSYLYGFQESYVAKAKKLRPKIQKKLGFSPSLFEMDYPLFLKKSLAVEQRIRDILRAEIEK